MDYYAPFKNGCYKTVCAFCALSSLNAKSTTKILAEYGYSLKGAPGKTGGFITGYLQNPDKRQEAKYI
jgi:hypothetical protein